MDSLEDGSRELQDYWNECRIFQESRRLSQEQEEEQHSPPGVGEFFFNFLSPPFGAWCVCVS